MYVGHKQNISAGRQLLGVLKVLVIVSIGGSQRDVVYLGLTNRVLVYEPKCGGWRIVGCTASYKPFLYRKRPPQQNGDRRKRHSSSIHE
jgi:hypothetical protein